MESGSHSEAPTAVRVDLTATPGSPFSEWWRRGLAFLLDCCILGLVGFTIGWLLFDRLAQFGAWGRLVGFGIGLVYFGVDNSRIGKGQTWGKRLLKIEVVDRHGDHISLPRSSIRYAILAAPFFLNDISLPASVTMSPVGYIISFIVVGIGGAIVYLFIFNRPSRQSLHDLAVQTVVVKKDRVGSMAVPKIWKGHLVIVGFLFAAVIGSLAAVRLPLGQALVPASVAAEKKVESLYGVRTAQLRMVTEVKRSRGKSTRVRYVRCDITCKRWPRRYRAVAREVASILLDGSADLGPTDFLLVTIRHGYDIGIAHWWQQESVRFSPQELAKMLRQAAEQGNAMAQYKLALRHEKGLGATKDLKEAVWWYRKAADQGMASAQYNLGVSYQRGLGLPKDLTQAVKWYRKAAAQGNEKARKQLEELGAE